MSRAIVLKVGTSTLTGGGAALLPQRLDDLAALLASLRQAGHAPLLVSSGAVAAGRERLAWRELPRQVPAKQMLAAVGQPALMARYHAACAAHQLGTAQVLLSRSDLERRSSWLNARNTLRALLAEGLLPIVNENDTVATEELRFGDNDRLSALVATLVEASHLVLLTDQDGLYSSDPRQDPQASLIAEVPGPLPASLRQAAGPSGSAQGTGGMASKLAAADLARRAGIEVLICHGAALQRVQPLLAGQRSRGTVLKPLANRLEARKRFLLGALDAGAVQIDDGAVQALRGGRSLLPVGVRGCQGEFARGDLIRILDKQSEIARGIVNYSADDLRRIAGRRSEEVEALLGYHLGDVVVHRNDLVVL